ncbi:DUF2933 domain-containing protein [Hydrogenophaga sp.]|uniref:DUF2933 domain-containing protein n=1 Tax=Hydrogenophaga sp. TaxID=1904254 RepID=UPI002731855F|nr:DUF2933 domain-containing protein [Hydrogenophaga sp.]MDP2017689.1 DUF2933 domain-containing protein [Hydrogenophaga sp.]
MNSDHTHHQQPIEGKAPTFWRSRYGIGLLVFGAVAAYFLLAEHRAHLFGAWPFLLLLACPLVHMFMHGGHGGHRGGTVDAGTPEIQSKEKP